MKNITYILLLLIICSSCSKDEDDSSGNETEFKANMREFVIGISTYAKAINPNFNIIPQNGIELVSIDGENSSQPHIAYLNAIDANGQEDLFYGYDNDDEATPATTISYLKGFLNLSKNANKTILVSDYCFTPSKMENSYVQNNTAGYVSFSANHRELNNIPNHPAAIHQENNAVITSMSQVKNFLYLINPANYSSKSSFIDAVTATNYDLVLMDLFFTDGTPFSASEISQLKNKANGGKRLVISYMSIGEAEDYRYYWQTSWTTNRPSWLDVENPDWTGNFKVKYWNPEWQKIIYGNDSSYLKKVLNAGFDGVYLDIIDAFEYYE
ncbi:endo alpha-1,4 polygalactosaminidase [Flavobacterium ardleyense]|uniref:Endo alpha-1,4 polygalactosaminidase n=1 Tax=Flavobacterium ardleyense TaxID=2038737 RepID=A0ABW5Z894_9FLAO